MKAITTFLTLSQIKGLGAATLNKIAEKDISEVGSINDLYDLYRKTKGTNKKIKECTVEEIAQYVEETKRILEKSNELNIQAMCKFDESFPKMLLTIDKPPIYLFAQGDTKCLNEKAVAIIGTRNISPLGKKIGERFGEVMAQKGFVVVSGFAEGCDTAGHTGCIKANRPTVAIMAAGLDTTYPKSNLVLREKVLETNGCLISEYPVGAKPTKFSFVERDRLQSGMSLGVIVVETGVVGGTMHAVNAALKANKPVGFFNYQEEHYAEFEHSRGNKKFIQENPKVCALRTGEDIDNFIKKCLGEDIGQSPKEKQYEEIVEKKTVVEEQSLFPL